MQRSFLQFLILVYAIVFLVGCKENASIPQEKLCSHKVNVEIGGYLIDLPRVDSYTVTRDSQSHIINKKFNCEIKELRGSEQVQTPFFDLVYRDGISKHTNYQQILTLATADGLSHDKLSQDVELYRNNSNSLNVYVYNNLSKRTGNNEPVSVYCHEIMCRVSYMLNNKLLLSYKITKEKHLSTDIVDIDNSKRGMLKKFNLRKE